MQDIRNDTLTVFKKTMLNKVDNMDSKMLNYWVSAIAYNTKNLEDFKNFLLKSQDYNNVVRNTFINIFYDKLSDNNYHELFEEFQKQFADTEISESDIVNFISTSKQYVDKYTKIISEMYEVVKGDTISQENLLSYLKKFQLMSSYTIDDLKDDIMNDTVLQDIKPRNIDDLNDVDTSEFSIEQQNEILSLWNDKTAFLEFYRNTLKEIPNNLNNKNIDTIINCFEDVYERNMNVHELLLYSDRLLASSNLKTDIELLKTKHFDMFIKVRNIVTQYLDDELNEDVYIKSYLPDIDQDGFLDNLVDSIINSSEYEHKMVEKLGILYKNLYDQCITEDDTKYIFEKVKADKCDIVNNEDLNNYIVEFKNETDHITERIFRIFIDTYERQPDIYEISKYIAFYRQQNSSQTKEDIDKLVENELYDSLEYHDVIKSKIKKIFTNIKNTNILPSVIYTVLHKVLQNNNKRDIDSQIEDIVYAL
jgi:hypothetical protein